MRTISENFKDFILHNEDIKPIIKQIQIDSTLDCEIRENKLQVYYRGAELFSIEEDTNTKKFLFKKSGNSFIEEQKEAVNMDKSDKCSWHSFKIWSFCFFKS